ncbi:MAG: TonB-dependent receptor, partial [Terriglobales bacterium]
AVQEFQLITNGYAAEYGRASGGVINIITRSGTNDLHGNLFGYLRHRTIQADNPFTTTPDPGYTRVQAGATLGGPIKRDKTFFYFSYELTRRQETGFSTIGSNNFGFVDFDSSTLTCRTLVGGVPTPAFPCPFGTVQLTSGQVTGLQQRNTAFPTIPAQIAMFNYVALAARASGAAINGVWPTAALGTGCVIPTAVPGACFASTGVPLPGDYVPMNSLVGNYPISEGTTVVALRLDHRFSPNQTGLLRVNVSPSTVTGIQVNGQNQTFGQNSFSRTSEQTFRDVNVTAQHTWIIGQNKINEFRFQYARRGLLYSFSRQGDSSGTFGDSGTNPDGGQVAINIPGFAFFGREPFSFADRTEQRYQASDNFSWLKGNHQIKFGADFNHIPINADFTVNFGGLYNFGSISATSLSPVFAGFPVFNGVQAYG